MQRIRRWYTPVVTTLTFLIVAVMGCGERKPVERKGLTT